MSTKRAWQLLLGFRKKVSNAEYIVFFVFILIGIGNFIAALLGFLFFDPADPLSVYKALSMMFSIIIILMSSTRLFQRYLSNDDKVLKIHRSVRNIEQLIRSGVNTELLLDNEDAIYNKGAQLLDNARSTISAVIYVKKDKPAAASWSFIRKLIQILKNKRNLTYEILLIVDEGDIAYRERLREIDEAFARAGVWSQMRRSYKIVTNPVGFDMFFIDDTCFILSFPINDERNKDALILYDKRVIRKFLDWYHVQLKEGSSADLS